ncbi:MAG: response regulator [Lachnospiraceae bacterium]|nr:response regulator [Lachnospiraceae bacterium]
MLQIGICDDQKQARLELRWKLDRILEKREIQNQIYHFPSGEAILSWIKKHPGELDLVFLDIEMSKINGMKTAHRLRETDSSEVTLQNKTVLPISRSCQSFAMTALTRALLE